MLVRREYAGRDCDSEQGSVAEREHDECCARGMKSGECQGERCKGLLTFRILL
jgi:hypothetical protein